MELSNRPPGENNFSGHQYLCPWQKQECQLGNHQCSSVKRRALEDPVKNGVSFNDC